VTFVLNIVTDNVHIKRCKKEYCTLIVTIDYSYDAIGIQTTLTRKIFMKIEICLKKILRDYGLDRHGVIQRIARDLKMNRQTVMKLYHNEAANISLDTIGGICEWLKNKGIPADILPGAILQSRPSELWGAITQSEKVAIYLGEYIQTGSPAPAYRWISTRDARVESLIVRAISESLGHRQSSTTIQTEYVPFRMSQESSNDREGYFEEDIKKAKSIFDQMQNAKPNTSSILIGSQRVNYLLELLVADLFDCEPFCPVKNKKRQLPVYTVYRDSDHAMPSCFGGLEAPVKHKDQVSPGIYYRDDKDKWQLFPYIPNKQCAGMVITVNEPGTQGVQVALFGFSGFGTEMLGVKFIEDRGIPFWPPVAVLKGKRFGIYICRLVSSEDSLLDSGNTLRPKEVEVVPLSENIIRRYLH
jgi:transcriptional regulator with XRE-family HTH domain